MADAVLRTTAIRWVSDDQPGWVEVSVVDADGREHRIIDKAPVLTEVLFTSATPLPTDLWVNVDTRDRDDHRVQIILRHVQTTEGLGGFEALAESLRWL